MYHFYNAFVIFFEARKLQSWERDGRISIFGQTIPLNMLYSKLFVLLALYHEYFVTRFSVLFTPLDQLAPKATLYDKA